MHMSHDMVHEMGHGAGMDMHAMMRDMRNRFWISFVFTVPVLIYSGNMFTPPAPPFGLTLDLWLFLLASAAILYPAWPFVVLPNGPSKPET
jgi:Cu2+-exporting ATPase